MSLTPIEAKTVYEDLSKIAISAGLKWLVDDVSVEISLGQQRLQKLKTETTQFGIDDDIISKRKGKPATFVIIDEYSENDKLRLLVAAIESVSSGSTTAVVKVIKGLSNSVGENFLQIAFAPDTEQLDIKQEREIISIESALRLSGNAQRLQDLLQELKEAI